MKRARIWGSFAADFVPALLGLRQSAGKNRLGALKLYLALTIWVDFRTRLVSRSQRTIQGMVGMSRNKLNESIRELEAAGLISVDRTGYTNTYQLLDRDGMQAQFIKVPGCHLRDRLADIPNRGAAVDAALAIYFVLLARRSAGSNRTVQISHKVLREHTGIRPETVKKGLDILVIHNLIAVVKGEAMDEWQAYPTNGYILRGEFGESQERHRLQ